MFKFNKSVPFVLFCSFVFPVGAALAAHGGGDGASKLIGIKESRGLIKNVYLNIVDDVSGECWMNAEHIRQESRLTLEQSGVRVYDEPLMGMTPFSVSLTIKGFGERTDSGLCYGSMEVTAARWTMSEIVGNNGATVAYHAINFVREGIAMGGGDLDDAFRELADTAVSAFAADVISGRRVPAVKQVLATRSGFSPLTLSAFKRVMNNVDRSN